MCEPTNTMSLIDLSIGYVKGKEQRVVKQGINVNLFTARLTCLIGNNGAGKSTLLRTISAFQPKLAGNIMMDGKDLDQYTHEELSRRIGVVLTERPTVQNLTVFEMVAMGRSPYTGFFGRLTAADRDIVADSIRLVGIDNLSSRLVGTLSDGERQKMMIAKALAQQTSVIFLDEPTAFLDYGSKVDILQLLCRLCHEEGKTILLSTHDLELALQLADDLWVMMPDGLKFGMPRQLADNGVLSSFINKPGLCFSPETMSIKIV